MFLEPITLPPAWNSQKDCLYFLELLSPVPSYTEALWEHARFHYDIFQDVAERALRCAYACDAALTHIEPSCLTPLEKIEAVLDAVRSRPQVFADPPRLLEYLQAGQFAENERTRILREYRLAGEQAWMYPVMEMIDLIGGGAAELRDTIACEEESHRAKKARPHGRKDDHSS